MKKVLIFLFFLFEGFLLSAQMPIHADIRGVKEASPSPSGDSIVFICTLENGQDELFLYTFEDNTLNRLTNSATIGSMESHKEAVNWIGGDRLLFLSKHSGICQQYILNLKGNMMTANGSSESSEYFLKYSDSTKETFYTSLLDGAEFSVYARKMYSNNATKISKGNMHMAKLMMSPDQRYLAWTELDNYGQTGGIQIYSVREKKHVKLKLPPMGVKFSEWSADGNSFIYTRITARNMADITFALYKYDMLMGKKKYLGKQDFVLVNNRLFPKQLPDNAYEYGGGAIWAPCNDMLVVALWYKMYLVDAHTWEMAPMEIEAVPMAWVKGCDWLLFCIKSLEPNGRDQAFLINMNDGRRINLINCEQEPKKTSETDLVPQKTN